MLIAEFGNAMPTLVGANNMPTLVGPRMPTLVGSNLGALPTLVGLGETTSIAIPVWAIGLSLILGGLGGYAGYKASEKISPHNTSHQALGVVGGVALGLMFTGVLAAGKVTTSA